MTSNSVSVVVKWSGQEFNLDDLDISMDVSMLKAIIYEKTLVLPERQKLLGLKYKGKTPADDVKLNMMSIKSGTKIMMMGSREDTLVNVIDPPKDTVNLNVVDDFDIEEAEVAIENREEYLAKIQKRVETYKIQVLNEPRDGKKLLVLDVDYTLFDHRSVGESGFQLMRPYLHEFLTAAYNRYDLIIWYVFESTHLVMGCNYFESVHAMAEQNVLHAATSMKWIEAKMQELGVLSNQNYKILFMLDSMAMITVHTPMYGIIETKPLAVIWGKYPQFSRKNTIMFDDLRRNFLMNPTCGLKIRPFKNAHQNRDKDTELLKLSKYLALIADVEDFETLDHGHWERFVSDRAG